jgi:hypothetical protein
MKRSGSWPAVLLLLLAGGVMYFAFGWTGSAQKAVRTQWEYGAVTAVYSFSPVKDKLNKIYGMAEICYLQNSGCRRLEIKHELDYGLFLQERALPENLESRQSASQKASEIAFQKAVVQLGSDGWEMIGEPRLDYESVNIDEYNKFEDKSLLFVRNNTRAVYFKRLKAQ